MRNQKWKPPNAYKHGAYSRAAIVPGEDEEEFSSRNGCPSAQPRRMPSSASPKPYGASVEPSDRRTSNRRLMNPRNA